MLHSEHLPRFSLIYSVNVKNVEKGQQRDPGRDWKPKLGIAPKYFKNVYLSYKNNTRAAT